ncbi:O-antigen ligase domain-containing protein [Cyanobium sp. Morenito 9A2]|uniref:O-antigen ligase domain-containing protein n=1 Tax=Cyanobium sp. Morenito 9A2 TaxID=2823718 RepID=UPI0020CDBB29|nr:O-antigen ligase domain-containing protein [Cyanobium sp. Morenito 9A2]MCP9849442.1 O-antigen ligase domain-containing protein [Cyanobium sp. Morenito 9A2]
MGLRSLVGHITNPSPDLRPENWPERLVWWSIVSTYPIWLIGGLYVVGSILGWLLLVCLVIKILARMDDPVENEKISISPVIWIWIIGMLLMEVALLAGHMDFNLGTALIIKSSIGWAKGWAALALYPMAGCLPIRSSIVSRAICIVGLHTLIIIPVLLITPHIGLPEVLYVSPLRAIGGPGNEFFDVPLYEIDGSTGELRWRLFTPWGPALGFVGNVNFMLSLVEKNRNWKIAGLLGSIVMCFVCKSRLAQICIIVIPAFTTIVARLRQPVMLITLGMLSFVGGLLSPVLLTAADQFWENFKGARAGSTRVRFALKRIAIQRWETEAPLWGHGVVEPGPHLVEAMPIGSHHTWAGLLFVKGSVGFLALAAPMLVTAIDLMRRAMNPRYQLGSVGLSMIVILFMYTFGENLEILVYLFWPGMLVMGLALQEKMGPLAFNPTSHALASGTI